MVEENLLTSAVRGKGRVAIVHHWDADGIASAALVIEEVRRANPDAKTLNRSPTIGRWALDAEEIDHLRGWGPDLLVIVDLAIRDDDLDAILDGLPGVPAVMVDHHRAEVPGHPRLVYHNPVAEGGAETDFPACTWVLRHLLGRGMDLLTVLGVFGDRGRGVEDEPVWRDLGPWLEVSDLTWDDMHLLVDLVDSSAKRVDREDVDNAVGLLLEGWKEPLGLVGLDAWNRGNDEVERALIEQLQNGPETEVGSTLIKTINTPYLVISTAARRLVRTRDNPVVVVVNMGYSGGEVQVYVRRTGELDLAPMIPRMRDRGLSAGGKSEVLGVIVPRSDLEDVMGEILGYLEDPGAPRYDDQ
ncbi:MAG: hypothetical protein GQ558_06570 [Thermoplasmata archaeon]|nr:hypothetical protein [Thermoplasmata archaeon]